MSVEQLDQYDDMHGDDSSQKEFVSVLVDNELFGIPVLQVQDVLIEQSVASIPRAPREVVGSINLRGRIVTVIDLRLCLGLPERPEDSTPMNVVTEINHEPYSLLVDEVGDVLTVDEKLYENTPSTLDTRWRDVVKGFYRLEERLLLELDPTKLLQMKNGELNVA